jgi:1,2-diacylglycerol 3-beta-glucosyltransferase
MATRIVAASFLAVSVLVAWLTITEPFAARLLQLLIVISIGYVGWLAWHGARVIRDAHADDGGDSTGSADGLPFVSIVLPASNEESVIGAAVSSLCAQRYAGPDGRPRYELVVVDDGSTDHTADRATKAAAGAPHVIIRRREPEPGPRTKGAALAWVHSSLRGEVIGAIDADTLVEPGFLERAMRAWDRDRSADAIQVAREPRNASVSWLTRAQGEEQLMDLTSQCGRWSTDGTAELRGNGMFVRRDALEAVGGWNPRALTEDLDLSTRLVANGRHVTLAPDIAVTEEAVEALGALWRQRLRWAEGSLRRLLEHGPGLLLGPLPLSRKADFLAFAGEFLVPPLFAATVVASLLTVPLPRPADWSVPAALFLSYGIGIFLLAIGGLWATGERGARVIGRAARGALFLSHWLLVVPFVLVRIAFGPQRRGFEQTPRFTGVSDQ